MAFQTARNKNMFDQTYFCFMCHLSSCHSKWL